MNVSTKSQAEINNKIYELAKKLKRDFKSVIEDVKLLQQCSLTYWLIGFYADLIAFGRSAFGRHSYK